MNRIAVVAGVPGVGKTTVVDGAYEKLKEIGSPYEKVNYGDYMFKLSQKEAGVKDRDEMRKMDLDLNRKLQRKCAKEIAKRAKKGPILVDTHCMIKTPKGYMPGLPKWVLDELNPDAVVLIEADSEKIAGRRVSDDSRKRDDELEDEIDTHQELNRALAAACGAMVGATVTIINNEEGKVDEAVNKMVEALK